MPFVWTGQCQTTFEELKELLTSSPVLTYLDFKKPFILETDASIAGLGAVLSQRQEDGSTRPIAYARRFLLKHERNYGITEMEELEVVWGLNIFDLTCMDMPAKSTRTTRPLSRYSILHNRQESYIAWWGMAIQELNLSIRHRSGSTNANADALSRSPLPSSEGDTDNSPKRVVAAVEAEGSTLPML